MKREFWRGIVHALEGGEPVELVSILQSGGSTPRGAGAMMAVSATGRSDGTVGGGNVEYAAQKLAGELLEQEADAVRSFRFVPGDAASLGMVCGGDVTLQFQYLSPRDTELTALLRQLMERCGSDGDVWLVRKMERERVVLTTLADREKGALCGETLPDGLLENRAVLRDEWFSVPAVRAGKVYLFGGGHVSQALVPAIAAVGFRPVVYDDRAEFADPALFPLAEATLQGDFLHLSDSLRVTADDYVVVVTRGHQADFEVLTQVLRSGAKYLGCIGSRKKLALCRERLLKAGFTAEEIDCVHAPIGLEIGAETPEEIAVSIAAELIAVRAGKL